jgi:hypothetical protein
MSMISFRTFFANKQSLHENRTPFGTFPGVSVVDMDTFLAINESSLHEDDATKTASDTAVSDSDSSEFGVGATFKKPTDAQLKEYLDRVFEKKTRGIKDRVMYPFLHQKVLQSTAEHTTPIPNADDIKQQYPDFDATPDKTYLLSPGSDVVYDVNKDTTFDVESLKRLFKKRPMRLLSQNTKMQKTGQGTATVMSFGIPALKGFVVNERTNELVIASTCPGAGGCIVHCYVFSGNYIRWSEASVSMTQTLNYLLNDPSGFFEQLRAEIVIARARAQREKKRLFVRWHDAGDFFSPEYKKKFFDLARTLPDVLFYCYTKIASVVLSPDKPENVVISFSSNAIPREFKQIDPTQQKTAITVDVKMFDDLTVRVPNIGASKNEPKTKLVWRSPDHLLTMIDRLAKEYDVDPDAIITNDELLSIPFNSGERHQYNVIVLPGESDDAATRTDVLRTFLLIHGKEGKHSRPKKDDPMPTPVTPRRIR